MDFKSFQELLKLRNINISKQQITQLDTYKQLLQKWNKVMDLTAVDSDEGIIEKHFYDSLLSLEFHDYQSKTLLDVGTGAGFPGLVLKIVVPSLKVTLLEPTLKRCNFLNEVIKTLSLKDVEVINQRAEDFIHLDKRESYDIVTARAVSRLNVLLELTVPFIKVGGYFIALKGKNALEELKDAENAMKILDIINVQNELVHLISEKESRYILMLKKEKKTNLKYPRQYGQIKKKPL